MVDQNVNGFVHEDIDVATGTAYVTASGKNAIVVVPSANHRLQPEHLENPDKFFSTADLVLVQLEIPMNVVKLFMKNAKNTELNLDLCKPSS